VKFEDGWGLVRASNTQPRFGSPVEAKLKRGLRRSKNWFEDRVDPPFKFSEIKERSFIRITGDRVRVFRKSENQDDNRIWNLISEYPDIHFLVA